MINLTGRQTIHMYYKLNTNKPEGEEASVQL